MKSNWLLFSLIIALLFIIFLVFRNCESGSPEIIVREEIKIDTVEKIITIEKPVPYKITELVIDSILIRDTLKIVRDYFSEKAYQVNYEDSNLRVKSDITVLKNSIELVKFDYEIYNRTVTRTIINKKIKSPSWAISIGTGASMFIPQTQFGFEINGTFEFDRHRIPLRYDIVNKQIGVGYQFQIFKSKK